MSFIELHTHGGMMPFNIVDDPIVRVIPQGDGSKVVTKSGAKEFVYETVEQVMAKIAEQESL